jgi:hypothetical protein
MGLSEDEIDGIWLLDSDGRQLHRSFLPSLLRWWSFVPSAGFSGGIANSSILRLVARLPRAVKARGACRQTDQPKPSRLWPVVSSPGGRSDPRFEL